MEQRNRAKADLLYNLLDNSELFCGTAQKDSRSIANVTFRTPSKELDAEFIAGAAQRGTSIKGHRVAGGMRASICNAVALESVRALAAWMDEFESLHCMGRRSL